MRFMLNSRARDAAADEVRERRLEEVRATVEEFLYSLAMILAGHDAHFTHCASRAVDRRLRLALRPMQSRCDTVRPDFGTHAELRVDGDLLNADATVDARVEFEDRSLRQTPGGRGIAGPRRRITMKLSIALQPCQIVGYTVLVSDAA